MILGRRRGRCESGVIFFTSSMSLVGATAALAQSSSIRARIPRRMFTSSRSSPARPEQSPQARHQSFRHCRIQECHRGQRGTRMFMQPFNFVMRRGWEARRRPDGLAPRRNPHLVRGDLHGRGEIERCVVGLAGIARHQRAARESSLVSPDISVPNTSAHVACSRFARPPPLPLRVRRERRPANSRGRADHPTASAAPASASSSVATHCADVRIPVAPAANAVASSCGNIFGATSTRRESPIVHIARAPRRRCCRDDSCGRRTTRVRVSGSRARGGEESAIECLLLQRHADTRRPRSSSRLRRAGAQRRGARTFCRARGASSRLRWRMSMGWRACFLAREHLVRAPGDAGAESLPASPAAQCQGLGGMSTRCRPLRPTAGPRAPRRAPRRVHPAR